MSVMKQRGVSLGTVLLVVTLLAIAGLAISGVSVTHLNLMAQSSSAKQAENLARSVVAAGMEKVLSDAEHDYGESRAAGEGLDISTSGPAQGSTARLTFNPDQAEEWGIPYSTNNIMGDRSVEGDGRIVPASALHLYGVAESGGKKRTVEVLFHVPAFPYAITSAGAVEARNGLVVGSLTELPVNGVIPSPSQPEAADIHSNANGTAVVLGRNTRIGGDVGAVGTVDLLDSPSILVMGEVLDNADVISLPEVDLADYDPELKAGTFDSYDDGRYSDLVIPGAARSNGDLNVASGGLKLDGGLLFVDGNLNVTGGLSGKGILAVTGNLTVDGEARASTESQLAILVGRDFRLKGRGSEDSYLQGLVYTGGDFYAESATLVGALVSMGGTDLEEARIFLYGADDPVTVSLGDTEGVTFETGRDFSYGGGGQGFSLLFRVERGEEVTLSLVINGSIVYSDSFTSSLDTAEADLSNAFDRLIVEEFENDPIARTRVGRYASSFYRAWATQAQDHAEPGGEGEFITLDPSKFFKLKDKIRVISWQEK
jgi:hypothetical protein